MRLHQIQHKYTGSTWSGTASTLINPLAMLAKQNTIVQCSQHFPHPYLWCNTCKKSVKCELQGRCSEENIKLETVVGLKPLRILFPIFSIFLIFPQMLILAPDSVTRCSCLSSRCAPQQVNLPSFSTVKRCQIRHPGDHTSYRGREARKDTACPS